MGRILVVDDEKSLRITLKAFFSKEGHEVETAENGDQVKTLLQGSDFDVIFSDIILPRMTGVDLLRFIKEKGSAAKVIMMTGEPTIETSNESLRLGAFDYLVKPINKQKLLVTLRNALNSKRLEDENRRHKEQLEQLVKERTAELLRQTKQLLAEVKERSRVEQELRESEERLRLSTELGNVAVWEYDFLSDTMSRSKNHDRLYGMDWQPQWDINTFLNATHPEDREPSHEIIKRSVSPGGPDQYSFDFRVIYPDRTIHWLSVSGQVVKRSPEGQGLTVRGCLIDITERKQIESDREKLLAAIEQVADGIIITDVAGIIVYVNPSLEKLTGYSAWELIGQNPRIFNSGKQDPSFYRQLWETIRSGNTWKGELINKTKGGTLYIEKATISPVFNKSGEISNYVAFKHDITEETQIKEMLQQSQKMESIGTLAGGIAHDFNNILFPIMGYVDMLIDDIDDESPLQEFLNSIKTGVLRAKDLIRQILMVSRQSKGDKSVVRIQSVLKEVIKLVRASIPATVEISCHIDNNCEPVFAEPTQIHQIAMNLITNAYHAIEPNIGKIRIQLEMVNLPLEASSILHLAPGDYVCLTVTDSGIGIEPQIMEKIFDPYFTTKQKGKGTGLGLSIVYGIVKSYNGGIQVQSTPGKKTSFMVYFPKAEIEDIRPTEKLETGDLNGTECILLIDDELPILSMLKQALERRGYKVFPETNGTNAIERFKANPDQIDLVITDLTMPLITGTKVAQALKEIRPDLPIIMITGYSNDDEKDVSATDLNIRALLLKPIDIDALCASIRKVFD